MNQKRVLSFFLLLCMLMTLPSLLLAEAPKDEIDLLIEAWEAEYGESDDWRMEEGIESKAFYELPTEEDISQIEALRFAIEALIEEQGLTVESFSVYYPNFGFWSDEDRRVWQVCFFGLDVETEPYIVYVYADDGEVQAIDFGAEG